MPKILMIDDDKDFSGLVSAHFSALGYAMTLTENGKAGLSAAASGKPDVILLDIMMPDMNGIEVLRELHAGDETSDIPVLVLSAKFLDDSVMDLFTQERNFRAFLSKPVALTVLQQKVETVLKK